MTTPSQPPTPEEGAKALPLALALPAPGRSAAPPPNVKPAAPRRKKGPTLVAVALVAVAAGAGALVGLPWWVRQQLVDEAAAHGITLTIDGTSIEGSGFRLTGVKATAEALPGASLTAPAVDLETSGLRPVRLTAKGADVALAGPWSQVEVAVAKWRAAGAGAPGSDAPPVQIVLDESRVVWTRPVGDSGRVEAANLHAELSSRGGAEVHLHTLRVTVAVTGAVLGPWRVDLDRTREMARVRVALDPAVPDSCTALFVGDADRLTHFDLVLPRSPPARIGLPPQVLGLGGKSLQIEANLHYTDLGSSRAELAGRGGVYGIEAAGLPRALDVSWEATAAGDPRQGMDLKKARLAVGPLVGAMTGTVKTFEDGARVDVAWAAGPVPCTAFDAPLGEGEPFDIAYQLRRLAEATGVTKVSGDVSARAAASFDTRDLAATHVEFKPQVSCSIALFGHR